MVSAASPTSAGGGGEDAFSPPSSMDNEDERRPTPPSVTGTVVCCRDGSGTGTPPLSVSGSGGIILRTPAWWSTAPTDAGDMAPDITRNTGPSDATTSLRGWCPDASKTFRRQPQSAAPAPFIIQSRAGGGRPVGQLRVDLQPSATERRPARLVNRIRGAPIDAAFAPRSMPLRKSSVAISCSGCDGNDLKRSVIRRCTCTSAEQSTTLVPEARRRATSRSAYHHHPYLNA